MIGYITLGTNDLDASGAFYDELLALLGGKRAYNMERFIGWSNEQGAMFCVTKPYDGNAATVGNGVMISLAAKDPDQVHAVYAKAIALGASDEGPAGPRGDTFYAGYFRDPDGNKLNVFCMVPKKD